MPRAASRRVDDGLPWSGTSPWQAKADICQVVPSCKLRSMQALTDFGRMRALTREPGKPKEWRRPPCRRRSNVEHDASSLGRCRHGGGSAQDMVPFDRFLPDMRAANRRSPSRQKSWPANRLFKSMEVVYDCRQARQSGKAKPDFSIHPRISVKIAKGETPPKGNVGNRRCETVQKRTTRTAEADDANGVNDVE